MRYLGVGGWRVHRTVNVKEIVRANGRPAFEAICDTLVERLGAERATRPGAGHALQRAPGVVELLGGFLDRAEA